MDGIEKILILRVGDARAGDPRTEGSVFKKLPAGNGEIRGEITCIRCRVGLGHDERNPRLPEGRLPIFL